MRIRILFSTLFVFLIVSVSAQEPTAWRNGTDGIYPDTDLLDSWPENGPKILWSYEDLGKGHASVAVSGGYIYTTGMSADGEGHIFKFDREGTLVYKKSYGPEFNVNFHGSRGTPVIVGDKIYYISGYGQLLCMNESDAKVLWEHDLVNEFGGDTISWGYNETPVIDGDIIYCTPGGESHNVIALNRHTQELIWTCKGREELTAYCTPLLFEHNGRKILTTHTESNLLGIDAASGELLWAYSHPNKWSVHANTPIYHDGRIFIFSGYGKGSAMLQLNAEGTEVKLKWESEMDSRMGGAVLLDGYIYASGDVAREWRCIDWETGKDMWADKSLGKGVVIAADDKLFGYTDRGELALINVSTEKLDVVNKIRVTKGSEQHWAHPVIDNGVLYVRHGKAVVAYEVGE